MKQILTILMALWGLTASAAQADMRLLMGDEVGCFWCQKWTDEIGPIYPKTTEGQTAPLIRQDIHTPLPEGVTLARALVFTPTFVLLNDGVEVGRIEGYPGEDFFWGLLAQMIEKAQIEGNS